MNIEPLIENFHFLRPWLLTLIALTPALIWLKNRDSSATTGWSRYFNHRFLAKMQSSESRRKKSYFTSILIAAVYVLLVLAAAGPSWIQKAQPVQQKIDSLIVIMDLSVSMLAEDTPPSRLVRAKQKIQDLLNYRKSGNTALIAYSGDSHVVTPLTDDTRTIVSNLSVLEPFMMPIIGSRPDLAINQALDLIAGAQAGSTRILLVTDHVTDHHVSRIQDSIKQAGTTNIQLDVLVVGTAGGGPIEIPGRGYLKDDKGSVVIAKPNDETLQRLASNHGGAMAKLTLDDRDLNSLNLLDAQNVFSETADVTDEQLYDQWEDAGYWLLVLAMMLILLSQRQFMSVIVLSVVLPQESHALDWADLWQTPDQRGSKLYEAGDYKGAAEISDSPHLKGDAYFREGDYTAAAEQYALDNNASAQFNKATSLAKNGNFEEALDVYNALLADDQNHQDAAFNKQIVEKLLQLQQQSQQQSGDGNQSQQDKDQQQTNDQDRNTGDQSQGSQNQDSQPTGEDSQSSETSSQQQAQNQQGQNQKSQSSNQGKDREQQPSNVDSTKDSTNAGEELDQQAMQTLNELDKNEREQAAQGPSATALSEALSEEEKRSYEQWMRRVPDDPSGLLRRKFEQQARQRGRKSDQPGEPLW